MEAVGAVVVGASVESGRERDSRIGSKLSEGGRWQVD